MYLEYWGLKEMPFENTPDPRFFYHSSHHEEALSRLRYVVNNNKGAAMLTGVFGCGKTAILRALVTGLQQRSYQTAFITNPQLKAMELLRSIARYLGAEGLPFKFSDMSSDYFLEVIERILINNTKDGRQTLVIIDEAHVITDLDVLEELRMLLNFQLEDKFLITLILAGQPELQERISKTKQLLQRMAISYNIGPLSETEIDGYINYRLSVAGASRQIFEPEAIKIVHKVSGGIPRRINHICDLSLFIGSANNFKVINGQVVEDAVSSFEV
ncbi:MAG: AAA family ATPase [Candidatus Omnitrophota bacterium]